MGRRVREVLFNWPAWGICDMDLVPGLVSACFRIGREVMRPRFDWPACGIRHTGHCFQLVSICFRTAGHTIDAAFPSATAAILRQGGVFPGCFHMFPQRQKNSKREEAWLPRPLHSARGNTLPLFLHMFLNGAARTISNLFRIVCEPAGIREGPC